MGKTIHGCRKSKEYTAWGHMIQRCYNPNNQSFKYYGKRGIIVCDRWLNSFQAFLSDVGAAPSPKHSLDRYPDINGNYEPSNVRWATSKQQSNNTRRNRIFKYNGQSRSISEWSEITAIPYDTLKTRFDLGWSIEKAIETPILNKNNNLKQFRIKNRTMT